jgi:class 3 adenylate cyclase
MAEYLETRNRQAAFKWDLRIGIHSGPVVSGVVGKRKYTFDIWGDAVNTASRMESSGAVGKVNVSAYTYDLIRNDFKCEYRGKIDAKGKGQVDMYFVLGPA